MKRTRKRTKNELRNIIHESVLSIINEAFKSSELRNWAKRHGGIKKTYADEGYPNTNVRQDALGDITDNDITYFQEFPSFNEANEKRRELMSEKTAYGRRSKYDMQSYFTIYRAKDGTCALVGINRKSIKTGSTWGGEVSRKAADRFWRDEHSPFPHWQTNRYTDDRDTYYYSRKGRDFGMRTNRNFQGRANDNRKIRSRMSDEQWQEYQKARLKDMDDYLNRHYGKGISKSRVNEIINKTVKNMLFESDEQWVVYRKAEQILGQLGYEKWGSDRNNPYVLIVKINGYQDINRIESILSRRLGVSDPMSFSVKYDSNMIGNDQRAVIHLPSFTHLNENIIN